MNQTCVCLCMGQEADKNPFKLRKFSNEFDSSYIRYKQTNKQTNHMVISLKNKVKYQHQTERSLSTRGFVMTV